MAEKIRCLFIDDDVDDQEIFRFALKGLQEPIELYTAGNGLEALALLDREKDFTPNMIFLDLNMPMMNGKECLRELRKISRLQHVPIIIFTTSANEIDRMETKNLGASDFMTKQTSLDCLKKWIGSIFEKYHIVLTHQ
jgi:CheY-like chemotaxis protein